jgi:hypothetical protein
MKLTGNRNQCQECKQYFNSNSAFDMHRTGEHGVNRRCMTPEEMTALGMLVNHAGFWITEQYHGHMDKREIEQSESDDGDSNEEHHKPKI